MKTARRASQVLFLLAFLVLFGLTIGRVDYSSGKLGLSGAVPADLFLRLDPLAALGTLISSRSFLLPVALWTVPVLLLAVFFGRAFCGWVCPLGTCIDGCDHLVREKRARRTNKETCWPKLKYYVLVGLLVTALLGSQLLWLFDPIPLLVRGLALGVFAPVQWLLRQCMELPAVGPLIGSAVSSVLPEQQMNFRSNLAALALLLALLSAGVVSRRFWCRSLCPLGALLGIVARISIFRRSVNPSCTECTLCELDCRMDAVGSKGRVSNPSECIYCYSCVKGCPKGAAGVARAPRAEAVPLSLNRRHLLAGIGLGVVWGLSAKASMALRPTRDGASRMADSRLIRPPGSVAEDVFTERCVRCGECMKVCPTNGLQPALAEAGLGGIWTPVLVPRAGECTQNCTLCGQICPTDAIQPFTIPEKDYLYIGRAAIDRSTCVVWESGRDCLVCDEVCSYDAIYWLREGGIKRPHVDPVRCVGCGICENNCPVGGPNAAIRVSSDGDKRRLSRDQQKAWRQANLVEHREPPPANQPAAR